MPKKYKYTKSFTYDGKRYYVHGDTLEEIYSKKAERLLNLKEGKIIVSGSMLVRDWVPICIEAYKPNQSEDTKKEFTGRVNKYIVGELGMYRLKDVTPLQCQRIMSAQAGKSKSHIDKLSQAMRFIFDKAVRNHYIFENPADDLILPKGTEGERRSITDYEREHFLKCAAVHPQFLLFELMLYCSCRPGEAIACIGDDIQRIDGTPMLHIRGTKTKNSDRFVPIPDHLYDRIRRVSPSELIVPNEGGNKYDKQSYKRLTARLRRELNISMGCKMYRNALIEPYPLAKDFVPYMFRHTYCTDLQKAGVDVRVAQRLMGHASIEITANIYTHVDMSEIIKAADLLDQFHTAKTTPDRSDFLG